MATIRFPPARCPQGPHHRCQRPGFQRLHHVHFQCFHRLSRMSDAVHILLKRDLLGRVTEALRFQPTEVRLRPAPPPEYTRRCLNRKELSRCRTRRSACLKSSRQRTRSRIASCSSSGTQTATKSPERCWRASVSASRRSVLMRYTGTPRRQRWRHHRAVVVHHRQLPVGRPGRRLPRPSTTHGWKPLPKDGFAR